MRPSARASRPIPSRVTSTSVPPPASRKRASSAIARCSLVSRTLSALPDQFWRTQPRLASVSGLSNCSPRTTSGGTYSRQSRCSCGRITPSSLTGTGPSTVMTVGPTSIGGSKRVARGSAWTLGVMSSPLHVCRCHGKAIVAPADRAWFASRYGGSPAAVGAGSPRTMATSTGRRRGDSPVPSRRVALDRGGGRSHTDAHVRRRLPDEGQHQAPTTQRSGRRKRSDPDQEARRRAQGQQRPKRL